jgi:hypothetical protein
MVRNIDLVSRKINELEDIAKNAENLFIELINELKIYDEHRRIEFFNIVFSDVQKEKKREVKRLYQRYYLASIELVKKYIPSKSSEFVQNYRFFSIDNIYNGGVLDYIELKVYNKGNKEVYLHKFIDVFENQRTILLSIPDVISVENLKLREVISSEFIQSELEESEILFENKFYRASGAIAGVALERHLRFLCDSHDIEYSYADKMDKINDKLKDNGILEKSQWRYIQHLGAIRNKCAHPDLEDVKEKDANDLIDGTKKVIRDIN